MVNNNTKSNKTDDYCFMLFVGFDHVPGFEWSFIISIVLNCILSVICCIGNAIVLVTIWINPILHTPSNCLLFSLAVSDLAVGLIVQPLCIIYKLSELLGDFDVYCASGLGSEFFALLFTITAFTTIVVISVDRFLAVHLHLRYNQMVDVDRMIKIIVMVWLFGLLITSGRAICLVTDCSIMISILTSLGVGLFLVTIACYIKIWITVQRHVKTQVYPSVPTTTMDQSEDPNQKTMVTNKDKTQFLQKKKSVITMLYVVGAFIACYVPYLCVLFLCGIILNWNPFSRALLNVAFPVAFLNSSLNPLLYFWRMKDLRKSAKNTIHKLTCRKTRRA